MWAAKTLLLLVLIADLLFSEARPDKEALKKKIENKNTSVKDKKETEKPKEPEIKQKEPECKKKSTPQKSSKTCDKHKKPMYKKKSCNVGHGGYKGHGYKGR